MKRSAWLTIAAGFLICFGAAAAQERSGPYDLLLSNGRIVDGTCVPQKLRTE
jgi:hypothetical protein